MQIEKVGEEIVSHLSGPACTDDLNGPCEWLFPEAHFPLPASHPSPLPAPNLPSNPLQPWGNQDRDSETGNIPAESQSHG